MNKLIFNKRHYDVSSYSWEVSVLQAQLSQGY